MVAETAAATSYNPYKNLLTKVRALLNADLRLNRAQIEQHQWMLMVKVADQQILIGKGGVNTMFYQFGSHKRKVCGPMDMIDLLKKLSRRRYQIFRVGTTIFWSEKSALKQEPVKAKQIEGYRNEEWVPLYKSAGSLAGRSWIPIKKS